MRLRWFQFRLRTLLLLTFVLAAGLGAWNAYVAPYRQQRRVMAAIERAGGSFESQAAGPTLLRRWFGDGEFQDITSVSLLCEDDTRKCLDGVLRLPRLESLYGAGMGFTDEDLPRLAAMTKLNHVILHSTSVTRMGVETLERGRPDLEVNIGLSFADLAPNMRFMPPSYCELRTDTSVEPPTKARQWAGKRVHVKGNVIRWEIAGGIRPRWQHAVLGEVFSSALDVPIRWSRISVTLGEQEPRMALKNNPVTFEGEFEMAPSEEFEYGYVLKNAKIIEASR